MGIYRGQPAQYVGADRLPDVFIQHQLTFHHATNKVQR
jgi:hypothetical protein